MSIDGGTVDGCAVGGITGLEDLVGILVSGMGGFDGVIVEGIEVV